MVAAAHFQERRPKPLRGTIEQSKHRSDLGGGVDDFEGALMKKSRVMR